MMLSLIMIIGEKLRENDVKKEIDYLEISENIVNHIIRNTYTKFDDKSHFKTFFGINFKTIEEPNKLNIVFKKVGE